MQAKKSVKRDTLLVSGLGNLSDLCPAAAVALRRFPGARLAFSSMAALPDVIVQNRPEKNGEVHLLGVGLTGDPAQLETALSECRKSGTRVVWHSVGYPFPASLPDSLRNLLEIDFIAEASSLADGLASSFKVEAEVLSSLAQGTYKGTDAKDWRERMEAEDWNFANTHDRAPLERLSRDLAECVAPQKWDDATRRLIAAYARWGGRELDAGGPRMKRLRKDISRIAKSNAERILVTGENGTGKETVAMLLHVQSGRTGPFLAFNCATVSRDLIESRLFGHRKGAFTGATENRPGLFREADGGTLFLDEIGELPKEVQGILLRVLQEGRVQGVGETEEVAVNVRVVAATNRDLAELVREGRFRQDLYFRLALVELHVPPLRERADDFARLAGNFWKKTAKGRKALTSADIAALADYDWPGNVRELHNVLERAALFPDKSVAELVAEEAEKCAALRRPESRESPEGRESRDGLESPESRAGKATKRPPPDGKSELLDDAIRAHVRRVLALHGGNISEAARALGVSRNTVRTHMGA